MGYDHRAETRNQDDGNAPAEATHAEVAPLLQVLLHAERGADGQDAALTLMHLGEPGISALIGVLQDPAADSEARRWAALALGQSGDTRTLAPLVDALDDPADAYVRMTTAIALGHLALQHVTGGLADPVGAAAIAAEIRALGDATGVYGRTAQDALVRVGAAAVPALIAALDAGSLQQRVVVPDVLGPIGDRRAVEPLVRTLGDAEPRVRAAAAGGLTWLQDPAAAPALLPLLEDP